MNAGRCHFLRLLVLFGLLAALTQSAQAAPLPSNYILTPPVLISGPSADTTWQEHPVIVWNSNLDQMMIAWSWQKGTEAALYACCAWSGATANAAANPPPVKLVSHPGGGRITATDLGYDPYYRKYLLVYAEQSTQADRGEEIYAVIFNENLTVQNAFLVWSWPERSLSNPKLALDAKRHRFLVVWNATNATTGEYLNIATIVIPVNGDPPLPPQIQDSTGRPSNPSVAFHQGYDEFRLIWQANPEVVHNYLVTQTLDAGTLTYKSGYSFDSGLSKVPFTAPVISRLNTGDYLVAFEAYNGTDYDIRRVVIDSDTGGLWFYPDLANTARNEGSPAITAWPGTTEQFLVPYIEYTTKRDSATLRAANKYKGSTQTVNLAQDPERMLTLEVDVDNSRNDALMVYTVCSIEGNCPPSSMQIYARRLIPASSSANLPFLTH